MNSLRTTFTHDPRLAYASSLVVAAIMAGVSAIGLILGTGLYRVDPKVGGGVATSTAGLLIPGFLAHDGFNLIVGLPILLGSLWLARRGLLIGLLLLPGSLYYILYTYTTYLIGSPFSMLFLPYVALVTLSAYSIIGLVASIDGEQVRQRLAGVVPARTVGAILIVLALLTLAQDASGAVATALAGIVPIVPAARHIWIADLVLEVPAVFLGGVLLWRRETLGFVAGAGLLFQYGLTPVALAAMMALQPVLTASPVDMGTIVALLVFALISFAPLVFFVRGAASGQSEPVSTPLHPNSSK
jgi:hypothetical protein